MITKPFSPAATLAEPRAVRAQRLEVWLAVVLTGIVLCFHVGRLFKAGGLWRDEAATEHLAANFSVRYVVGNADHELFPVLVPAVLHAYGWVAGNSDVALRVFGALVGVAIIALLWWVMWTVRNGVPLLALALLGFNGVFVCWGDSLRGYGPGVCLLLLTVGLLWRVVEQPSPWRIAAAAASGLGSVQCLFHNSVLLLAVCLGAGAVALARGKQRQALLLVAIGLPAALSLLPYLQAMRRIREWDMLVRSSVGLEDLCSKANEALSASGWWHTPVWILLLALGLALSLRSQFWPDTAQFGRAQRAVLLFSGIALLVGVAGYFGFLAIVGYRLHPWYYVAPMGMAGLFLDCVFDSLSGHSWIRGGRIVLALLIAGSSVVGTCQQVQLRQTNVDLVALKLNGAAVPGDLVVVTPWYNGVSFQRYYSGPAVWMTIPPLSFHKFHRYDLVKAQMILADQNQSVKPILDKIRETLEAGHRVWVAGALPLPGSRKGPLVLSGAPDKKWGWREDIYSTSWAMKVSRYLQASARHMHVVSMDCGQPVSPFENLSLKVFEGWRES